MTFTQSDPSLPKSKREPLLRVVHDLLGSPDRPDDSASVARRPPAPGRWDAVVRSAVRQLYAAGPSPEPWKAQAGGPGPQPWQPWRAYVGARHGDAWLNPQPMPPRYAFLLAISDVFLNRVELIHEAATVLQDADQRSIASLEAHVALFVSDLCGTEWKLANPFSPTPPFPGGWPPGVPTPPQPPWPRWSTELDGLDQLVLALPFERAAQRAFHRDMARILADAAGRLVETGLTRLA
jgi:hypothetical protein